MGTSYSSKKFAQFVFDYSDTTAEEQSKWTPTKSGKKKSCFGDSPVDKYNFLESLAGGMEPKGKKLRDETITIHETDDPVKERIFRSDTALQSSSSNYNLKGSSGSKGFRKGSERLHLADNELVSIISDEDDDDISSIMSSNDLADAEGSSEEKILVQEMESGVVVHPKYVEYGTNCYWKTKLTFFSSSIKLDALEEENPMNSITFEWKTSDLISIESQWLDPSITADIRLHIKSEHPKSGILELNFTVSDSNWAFTQELIKSLDEQYKEKWDVDLESNESFEDITYQGECDSISIFKRDFELLDPEKFINDTIVDFYIEYLKKIKPADERFHFFNSFFFKKLADITENQLRNVDAKSAFERVRKWTKKVNIFQKDYIFIPVNFRLHWSLIIICHPGEVVNYKEEELQVSLKVPCILHMDSIKGSHRGLENCIKFYLWEQFKERSNDISEDISRKFKDLLFLRLEVPQQENSYDCGLFMLHYMELFMKQAPINFNPLSSSIGEDWFFSIEASLKRARIKRLIFELAKSNSEHVLSPELSPEDIDESEVEILHENCLNRSRDGTPILEVNSQSQEFQETGDTGVSLTPGSEQNDRQLVLYDPSIVASLPTKENDETDDIVDKQVAVTEPCATNDKPNKVDSFVSCLHKSLTLLRLKENQPCGRRLSGEDNVAKSVVVKDSDSEDDVCETCVVEDSDSDDSHQRGAGLFKLSKFNRKKDSSSSSSIRKNIGGSRLSLHAAKRRQPMVSEAQKRLRRSSSADLQVISLCE